MSVCNTKNTKPEHIKTVTTYTLLLTGNNNGSFHLTNYTRSSAVADRLRDASCHWIFC